MENFNFLSFMILFLFQYQSINHHQNCPKRTFLQFHDLIMIYENQSPKFHRHCSGSFRIYERKINFHPLSVVGDLRKMKIRAIF